MLYNAWVTRGYKDNFLSCGDILAKCSEVCDPSCPETLSRCHLSEWTAPQLHPTTVTPHHSYTQLQLHPTTGTPHLSYTQPQLQPTTITHHQSFTPPQLHPTKVTPRHIYKVLNFNSSNHPQYPTHPNISNKKKADMALTHDLSNGWRHCHGLQPTARAMAKT